MKGRSSWREHLIRFPITTPKYSSIFTTDFTEHSKTVGAWLFVVTASATRASIPGLLNGDIAHLDTNSLSSIPQSRRILLERHEARSNERLLLLILTMQSVLFLVGSSSTCRTDCRTNLRAQETGS